MTPRGLLAALAVAAVLAAGGEAAAQERSDIDPSASAEAYMQALETATGGVRAQLRPRRKTVLGAPMAGRILELAAVEGNRVAKGARLVAFDCRTLEAQRRQANAKVAAAAARDKAARQGLELKIASVLEAEVAAAEVAAVRAEAGVLATVLANCVIAAPFAGTVTERLVDAQQYVPEGEPLLELIDTRDLEVDMVVPSGWLRWLKPETPFTLVVDETGATLPAKVDRVVGKVNPVSQTVRILGRLAEVPDDLLPGMSGLPRFERPAADR